MPRPQAKDYHEKRSYILAQASYLFAKNGFHATSITEIAAACKTSKSRLYHYFSSKEQVLYEILRGHAQILASTFLPISEEAGRTPEQRLEKYTRHLLRINVKSRDQHKLILSELDALPQQQKEEITQLLRQPITAISSILAHINPAITKKKSLQFPAAMMFLGMVNWSHTWFSDEGDISIEIFAKLICGTFIGGFSKVDLKIIS